MAAADVDFAAGLVVVVEHKTGRPRFMYLSPEAVELYREQAGRHPTGPLLPTILGTAFTRFTLQKAMTAARTRADIPHAVCYGLRHACATRTLAACVPDATVAGLLCYDAPAPILNNN